MSARAPAPLRGCGSVVRHAALLAAVAIAPAACSVPHLAQGVGPAEDFGAAIARRPPGLRVDIDRAGYVAALQFNVPGPTSQRPATFLVYYPRFPTDQKRFDAGRHRVHPLRRGAPEPMECEETERPTLDGCRRPLELLPGYRDMVGVTEAPGRMQGMRAGTLLVVADEFIDPYVLGEELYWKLLQDWEGSARLREAADEDFAAVFEALLREQLGATGWYAVVEISQGLGQNVGDEGT